MTRRPNSVQALVARHGDVLLAGLLTVVTQLEVWTIQDAYFDAPRLPTALTTLTMTAALLWRRRNPVRMSVVIASAIVAQVVVAPTSHPTSAPVLVWMVAVYSLAAHADRRGALIGGGLLVGAVDLWAIVTDGGNEWVFLTAVLAGFWSVGRIVRSRNRLAAELVERTIELEGERDQRARFAVAEERTRIARELHDIIAHSLGVIVVQAGAERLHLPESPVRDAFVSIEGTGREALEEMGRLLGMLRTEGQDQDELAPQPGLARIDSLLQAISAAGVEVELVVEGDPHALTPGTDVSAYRIIQEALTNTVRHSGSQRARVLLRWEPSALEIEVADAGIGPQPEASRRGHGLVGIRERVALYGGTLATGRSDLGGYLLAARLPIPVE